MSTTWCCVRQRAGPFVKAFSTDNYRFLRLCHIRDPTTPALSGTSVDRLELRLALFEYDGVFYTLTFAPEYLPRDWADAMKVWRRFLQRVKRWRKDDPLDYYVYRIEGLHGDHRLHIHAFFRGVDMPSEVVKSLWTWGFVDGEPFDEERVRAEGGYRRLAKYFTKERPEVGRHPWGASQKLKSYIPPPSIRESQTGRIPVPRNAVLLQIQDDLKKTKWGYYQYVRYLLPKK